MQSLDELRARVTAASLRGLLDHWEVCRATQAMPALSDIDPTEIPRVLPHVWICDYDADGATFRYRLSGEAINALNGYSLKNRTLSEVISPTHLSKVQDRYLRVVQVPAVVLNQGLVYADQDRSYRGERLILPLGVDGWHADGLIGATCWDWGHGRAVHPDAGDETVQEWVVPLIPEPECA